MQRYTALRLSANLDAIGKLDDTVAIRAIAEEELNRCCTLTTAIATALLTD